MNVRWSFSSFFPRCLSFRFLLCVSHPEFVVGVGRGGQMRGARTSWDDVSSEVKVVARRGTTTHMMTRLY
jgi:hypothetical protein